MKKFIFIILLVLIMWTGLHNSIEATENQEVFREDFSDTKSGWLNREGNRYKDGWYEIKVDEEYYLYWSFVPLSGIGTNYSLEVDMKLEGENSGEYGIIFNYQDDSNYYVFLIDSVNEEFCLDKVVDKEWVSVIEWTKTGPLKEVNRVRLTQSGAKVSFYINGEFLKSTDLDTVINDPGLALVAGSYDLVPVVARFDNLVLSWPKEEKEVKLPSVSVDELIVKMKQFTGDGYTLNYPRRWIGLNTEQMDIKEEALKEGYVFLDPEYPEAMLFMVLEISIDEKYIPLTPEKFAQYMEEEGPQIGSIVKGSKIVDKSKYLELDGRPTYNYLLNSFNGSEDLNATVYITYKDSSTVFCLFYVANREIYDKYLDLVFVMLNSLDFKND